MRNAIDQFLSFLLGFFLGMTRRVAYFGGVKSILLYHSNGHLHAVHLYYAGNKRLALSRSSNLWSTAQLYVELWTHRGEPYWPRYCRMVSVRYPN